MMKISKRSWHYRLLRWITPNSELVSGEMKPRSLCSYVGELLAFCLIVVPIAAVLIVVFGPFGYLLIKLSEWIDRRQAARVDLPPSEPRTLLGKWLKAKREKVCPMLEWED